MASERETIAEIVCKMINHPSLCYAYDHLYEMKISRSTMFKFYCDLTSAIKSIAEGGEIKLPEGTSMFGLASFIADEQPEGGVKALCRLGYKADDIHHIIHPDGRRISHGDDDKMMYVAYKLKNKQ